MGRVRVRFFADAMLGSLCRWLRTLGYDVLYENRIDDNDLIRSAAEEDRIILTRDYPLSVIAAAKGRCLLIKGMSVAGQIREVNAAFGLETGSFLTRCLRCNDVLEDIPKEAARGHVADYVFNTQERFLRCPGCKRLFWAGTHRERMREAIERMLKG